MNQMQRNELVRLALAAREKSYVPYSHFSVGAALLTGKGEIFTGCNVENSSYPAGICAERTAIFSAVAAGNLEFETIAIAGGIQGKAPKDFCMPCGICRQVMAEFCDQDFMILIVKSEEEVQEFRLRDLLPHVFDSKSLTE